MMNTVTIPFRYKEFPADTVTPVGIYLRLRDRFPGCLLLESSDSQAAQNSFSFLCIKPVAGIRVEKDGTDFTLRSNYPGGPETAVPVAAGEIPVLLDNFLRSFRLNGKVPVKAVAGLFGFSSYDAVQCFDTLSLRGRDEKQELPLLRYDLFRYIIAIDHYRDKLYLCENSLPGETSALDDIETLIGNTNIPAFPFSTVGEERANSTDETFLAMIETAKAHCRRGDVFQLVLSRRFEQAFTGDDFNVYRALRSINPSPYLFYFDYGSYRLFGSSPEAQLQVIGGQAFIHPIAGTFRRSGNEEKDRQLAEALLLDPKENAEHIMLVDLARNDLSRHAQQVNVDRFREIHYYSHVIHLVSRVSGRTGADAPVFRLLADTFPAGTLSGAPKYRAMQLIDRYEPAARGFYGGCIGFAGFEGDFNHAIIIRSFLSRNNTLYFQAGAGIVAKSEAAAELQEVNNKLQALREALVKAAATPVSSKQEADYVSE